MLRRFWNWVSASGPDYVERQIAKAGRIADRLAAYGTTSADRATETLQHHALVVKQHAALVATLDAEHRETCREILNEHAIWAKESGRAHMASFALGGALASTLGAASPAE